MPEIAASDRPTFAQAFASEGTATDSQTVTTSTDTAVADQSAATTAQPATSATGEATPATALTTGEPPQERWPTILENARTKAKAEATAEFQQQYGWAQQVDRAAVEEASRIGQLYQQDRAGYIRQVLAEAITDPTLAPLVRSEAARALASGRQIAQTPPAIPDVQVQDAQGQVIGNLRDIVQAHLAEYAAKELQPLKQDFESRQQRDQAERSTQALNTAMQDIYSEALDVLPGFKEHEGEIAKVFATLRGADPARDLRTAWKQVVGGTLGQVNQVKAQTLDELKTKAAASAGSVNPGSAVVAATHRPTSFHDKSLKW